MYGTMLFFPAKNRRKSPRQWIAVPVVIRSSGRQIDAYSINISKGGMYLFAAADIPAGDQIKIEFCPPHSKEPIRTCGTVRRRALYLYAIEFLVDRAETNDHDRLGGNYSAGSSPA